MPTDRVLDVMRDPATPDDVEITAEAREPVWDPTLGIPVPVDREGQPVNRLVTLGDSLTHGFQSFAIYNTDLSYPAIIAHELGWLDRFRYPTYYGHGGLPLNLEMLSRTLEREFGDEIDWWELPFALFTARTFMDEVEDWWERGPGSVVPNVAGINHNLAVYGWDLRDTLAKTADTCKADMARPKEQPFRQLVENANERAAIRVLESARDSRGKALTPVGAAKALGDQGTVRLDRNDDGQGDGIETLIVFLGSNNALKTVTELKVVWSADGYDDPRQKERFTVWRPTHFQKELDQLVTEVRQIKARHVIWCTVPHVTIAPIARGVDVKVRPESRYFPFYTRVWIRDEDFDHKDDPNITNQQARAVDSAIDQYNEAITEAVRAARNDGKDWYLYDACGLLDRVAARRYIDSPAARPDWWSKYDLPHEISSLTPVPNSRFFTAGPSGRTNGGLFSLDGVHPTTIAYGILAQELINVMQRAGVTFYRRDGSERIGPVRVDFNRLIRLDTLISHPPKSIRSNLAMIAWFDERFDFVTRMFRKSA